VLVPRIVIAMNNKNHKY